MITEVRHFIFQETDVQRALATFRKNRGDPLPAGNVVGVHIVKKNVDITCVIDVDCDKSGRRQSFTFAAEELLPALISYCISKNVPLPAKSPKFLKLFQDQKLGFVVPINLSDNGLRRLQQESA